MEATSSTHEAAKKFWHILRAVFFMLRKGISKHKITVDLHLFLKNSNKAINNFKLMIDQCRDHHHHHHHHLFSSLTCRSNDAISFVSPREYEFSCSNSPAISYFNNNKRNKHYNSLYRHAKAYKYDDVSTVAAVQKALEMLNAEAVEGSPIGLTGFGKSPVMVRQLRVTDSPFPVKEEGSGGGEEVDKDAEEFIKRFYKDLKKQKSVASAFESPFHEFMWGR